jgi:hypothetical protein
MLNCCYAVLLRLQWDAQPLPLLLLLLVLLLLLLLLPCDCSVMLNWEMEFKKWCPAFKLLTYYGSAKERKAKRQGWSKPHAFHVCITSYTLVLQDAKVGNHTWLSCRVDATALRCASCMLCTCASPATR